MYSAPTDNWDTDGAPLACENAPYNIVNGLNDGTNDGQPAAYKLAQNYPNPFNPATVIYYSIPERSKVTLKVFNLLGQEVATLVNQVQEQGSYPVRFEANNLASGLYFYKLEAGNVSLSRKMLLLK
jgi:hypothetical protein